MRRPGGPEPVRRPAHCAGMPAAALILAGACGDDIVTPPPPAPVVMASEVAANPHNVLSALVTAHVRFADSAAVYYRAAGGEENRTPAVNVRRDSALVPVLGLLADTDYALRVTGYGRGGEVSGYSLTLKTGTLPADLPEYVARGSDPSPGYVVFAAQRYGIVIDNTGRVVWYRMFDFPGGPGLNFHAQPTGRYFARPTTPEPTDLDLWLELDPLGNVTRSFGCARGLQARFHDLIVEPDGSYWVLCDEIRTIDLTRLGGLAAAVVIGTAVQHVSEGGALRSHWSPFDHFVITDIDAEQQTSVGVNWTHGNALTFDTDGNLLVSFRNLGEIAKIDAMSGEVLWRMGGQYNQFAFVETTMPPFAGQHGVRATAQGRLLLLDNLGDPAGTRAERITYDAAAGTARLVASYGPDVTLRAQLGGSVQDLPGGRALVSFGSGGRVEEYDASGQVVWRIEGDAGYVFRAQRFLSLYHPGESLVAEGQILTAMPSPRLSHPR